MINCIYRTHFVSAGKEIINCKYYSFATSSENKQKKYCQLPFFALYMHMVNKGKETVLLSPKNLERNVKTQKQQSPQKKTMPTSLPTAQELLAEYAQQGVHLRELYFAQQSENIERAARLSAMALAQGKKILLCGNGGSAADAQHIAGELVNRFLMDRPPLPAIALHTDTSVLTSIGNDFGYEEVFAKQVTAHGQEGDVFIGISTSGKSPNVLAALHVARQRGLHTIGLVGGHASPTSATDVPLGTGQMAPLCDILLPVPHSLTPLVQEIHIATGHMLCRLIDYFLFENVSALGLSAK